MEISGNSSTKSSITETYRRGPHALLFSVFLGGLLAFSFPLGATGTPVHDNAPFTENMYLTSRCQGYDLGGRVMTLRDESCSLGIAEVSGPALADRFIRGSGNTPNFGLDNSCIWLRFTLTDLNRQDRTGGWLLEVGYPLLDQVELYLPEKGNSSDGFLVKRSGDSLPFRIREYRHRNFVFNLPLVRGETETFYLRVRTESAAIVPLTLWTVRGFLRHEHLDQLALGLYYGVILVMILYNLFIFLSLRDRAYLCYVLYIFCFLLFQAGLNGLSYEFLWPQCPWLNGKMQHVSLFASLAGALLFSMVFLGVRGRYPRINRLFQGLLTASLLMMLLSFFVSYGAVMRLGVPLAIVSLITMLATGVLSWLRKYKPARFYLVAWSVFLVAQVVSALNRGYGLFPSTFVILYCGQIGSALEVVLLSLALADRINVEREEKRQAQERAIQALRTADELNDKLVEYNRNLEKTVEGRTRELTLANEKLMEMDQLKSDFLASVSHELRTPLTSIVGFASIIRERLANGILPRIPKDDSGGVKNLEKIDTHLRIITSEGERLTGMINDILDFSKLESGEVEWGMRENSVAGLLEASMDSTMPLFKEKSLEMVSTVEPDLPNVVCDKDRMVQVLINLMGNAAKFTDQGRVTCSARREGDEVVITVRDTGPGIPLDDLDNIFDKFKQVGDTMTGKPRGSGLGLPICKHIVTRHGGRIRVESQKGRGSAFHVSLPIALPPGRM